MSNRLRPHRPADPTGALQQVTRCPDCYSQTIVTRDRVTVAHDRSCPALAQLERQGRTVQVVIASGPTTEGATLATVALTRRCREIWPDARGVRISTSPYADLHGPSNPNNASPNPPRRQ